MDETVILVKIESLKRCLDRIKTKIPQDAKELSSNLDSQDIIILNLERAVQLCVDIAAHVLAELESQTPQTMAESFVRLHEQGIIGEKTADSMRKSVGFRDIAVHEYQIISWDAVFAISTKHLDDFKIFAGEVMAWMDDKKT